MDLSEEEKENMEWLNIFKKPIMSKRLKKQAKEAQKAKKGLGGSKGETLFKGRRDLTSSKRSNSSEL